MWITNTVELRELRICGKILLATATASVHVRGTPSGTIIKIPMQPEVYSGQFATYTITYHATNTTCLEIRDIFNSALMSYIGATPTPTEISIIPGSISWSISHYQPCMVGTITVVMQVKRCAKRCTWIPNVAELSTCGEILLARATASVHVGTLPVDIWLHKEIVNPLRYEERIIGTPTFVAGDEVLYYISYGNYHPYPAYNIELKDTFIAPTSAVTMPQLVLLMRILI
jgi:hypothetical protein